MPLLMVYYDKEKNPSKGPPWFKEAISSGALDLLQMKVASGYELGCKLSTFQVWKSLQKKPESIKALFRDTFVMSELPVSM